ncbi:MFS transporter [Paenibacillus sp. PL91]|uniref:MFS transporter n=1 Tax=Paenibacillus sp. PL91 TaxID=2729538 RepID=UPI001CB8A648|nr:MFS transporter [Paenibacillus sp. PL91]
MHGGIYSHFTAGIVNVSLPHFMKIFQTNLGTVQWITTGYLLVIASLLPLMGKLGDRFGHRHIHNLGYLFFTLSSLLVAFSPNVYTLLILRMVQAIGAAMFQATNIALITYHFPKEQRGQALGIMSSAVAIGGMTGPIAGGIIAEWLSWQWLFLIHVPVVLVATWLAFRYIPSSRQERMSCSIDSLGAILFMIVISTLIYGISSGNTRGWLYSEIISVFTVGFISLAILLFWELRQNTPFLPIKAFRIPAVTYGLIISCASFVLANTVLVVMPFYLSGKAGYAPAAVGYIMTSYPMLLACTSLVAGHLSDRFGSGFLMITGLCGMGAGLVILAFFLGQLSVVGLIAVLALIGMGMGLIASPNNSFIMRHVPLEYAGSIGGMIALTRNTGMVLGAALGLGIMNTGQIPSLNAFQFVFVINIAICIVCVVAMGYRVRLERRRDRESVEK